MSALIDIKDVTKSYQMSAETTVRALDGGSVAIEGGDYVAIMGPSGSGKSTLMNLIGCLDTPSGGSYQLKGREIAAMTDDMREKLKATLREQLPIANDGSISYEVAANAAKGRVG